MVKLRLKLFTQVCQAIQHAHHKGIIHRDIKPSNILVSTQDGKPFAKVIDFGIAKATNQRLTDRTLFTEHVNMIGTPAYMSPEQADGNIDIDTRTDVYSLGVVLYELLTGHTPFDSRRLKSAALNEIARIIREEDPPKPSTRVNTMNTASTVRPGEGGDGQTLATLAKARGSSADAYVKTLQGEIDWMVMKAIEKDRARRYATPNEFAEDVERHLNGSPILAAPPSLIYQATKFAKKHRVPVIAGIAIAGILLLAVALVSALAIKLEHQVSVTKTALVDAESARRQESAQRQEADRQRQEAEHQRGSAESATRRAKYESARNQAQYLIEQKLLDQALVAAKEAFRLGGNWQDGLLLSRIVNESRKTWHLDRSIPLPDQPICAAICPTENGDVILIALPAYLVEYDLETGRILARAKTNGETKNLVAFRGATGLVAQISDNTLQIRALNDLSETARHEFGTLNIIAADAGMWHIAVTLSDHNTQVFSNGLTLVGSQPWPKQARLNQNQPLTKLAISPDGKWVVASGITWWDDTLFWNVTGNTTFTALTRTGYARFIDNTRLAGAVTGLIYEGTTLSTLSLDAVHPGVTQVKLCEVPNDDLGIPGQFTADAQGICLPYSFGIGVVTFGRTSDQFPDVATERYASLLCRKDLSPRPLAISNDGSRFALVCKDRLIIFGRNGNVLQANNEKGRNAAMGRTALYEVKPDKNSLNLRITPLDSIHAPMTRRFATIPTPAPGWDSIACGTTISQDQRTLAVRFAEAHVYIGSGQKIQNHSVVIYPGLDPRTGALDKVAPIQIRLLTQDENADAAAREYHDERILQLSPDGKNLLIGTRLSPNETSVAELYRTTDGNLVHHWPAGQLSALVTAAGSLDCFADVSQSGNVIRLISWKSGNVEREFKASGKVEALCGDPEGKYLFASLDGTRIARYDLKTGTLLSEFPSELLPTAVAPDGKVFVAFAPDTGEVERGSIVLADGNTGVTAILSRDTFRDAPAQFAADGQSFMLGNHAAIAELMRNLSPDDADRILDGVAVGPLDLAVKVPVEESPPVKVFPASQMPATQITPCIEATDMESLTANLGNDAVVKGRITWIGLTRSKNGLMMAFGEKGKCFMIYVPPEVFPAVNARFGGRAVTSLDQKLIQVTGTIIPFRNMPEIKLSDAGQIELLESPPATSPTR